MLGDHAALGIAAPVAGLEQEPGASFDRDEVLRFQHRACFFTIIKAAVAGGSC